MTKKLRWWLLCLLLLMHDRVACLPQTLSSLSSHSKIFFTKSWMSLPRFHVCNSCKSSSPRNSDFIRESPLIRGTMKDKKKKEHSMKHSSLRGALMHSRRRRASPHDRMSNIQAGNFSGRASEPIKELK